MANNTEAAPDMNRVWQIAEATMLPDEKKGAVTTMVGALVTEPALFRNKLQSAYRDVAYIGRTRLVIVRPKIIDLAGMRPREIKRVGKAMLRGDYSGVADVTEVHRRNVTDVRKTSDVPPVLERAGVLLGGSAMNSFVEIGYKDPDTGVLTTRHLWADESIKSPDEFVSDAGLWIMPQPQAARAHQQVS